MFLIYQFNAYFFIIKRKYIFKIKHYFIPIDEKTSTIEEVDHEVLIGRPDYSEIVEDQSQNCWPKVASMKAIFEDMSNWKGIIFFLTIEIYFIKEKNSPNVFGLMAPK